MLTLLRNCHRREEKARSIVIFAEISLSDNGLKIHKGKSHKTSELPQLEKTRDPGIDVPLNVSPVKDVREEVFNLQATNVKHVR